MKTRNAMQLKAFIKNKSVEVGVPPQHVLQIYMLERLLERISQSSYQKNFIVKGGFLISTLVGLSARTTMDLDTTIRGFDLNAEEVRRVLQEIISVQIDDDLTFEITDISSIRISDLYPGIRVSVMACYSPICAPLTIDITTGDVITPCERTIDIPLMFENRSIKIMAYTLETVLAEKLQTLLARDVTNTRPRDFYDIHILTTQHLAEIDQECFREAFLKTSARRGTDDLQNSASEILLKIQTSPVMQSLWKNYQRDYSYAQQISFDEACLSVQELIRVVTQTS